MPEKGIEERIADFDSGVELLQKNLAVDGETAVELGSIQVQGPDERCGQMALAEFLASEHGQEQGPRIVEMAQSAIANGANAEQAVEQTLGFTAKRDAKNELVKQNPHTELDGATQSKKKAF